MRHNQPVEKFYGDYQFNEDQAIKRWVISKSLNINYDPNPLTIYFCKFTAGEEAKIRQCTAKNYAAMLQYLAVDNNLEVDILCRNLLKGRLIRVAEVPMVMRLKEFLASEVHDYEIDYSGVAELFNELDT